jgi:hypothetical protein
MTELEWKSCADPGAMLEHLRGKYASRLFRLFAVACCRNIENRLQHEESRQALEVGEQFADGSASEGDRRTAYAAAEAVCEYIDGEFPAEERARGFGAEAALSVVFGDDDYPPIPTYATTCAIAASRAVGEVVAAVAELASPGVSAESAGNQALATEQQRQCALIRDIFGETLPAPCPQFLHAAPQVIELAREIYDNRAFGRIVELHDVLRSSGCNQDAFLDHCRAEGLHTRGCWLIDAILDLTRAHQSEGRAANERR